MRANKWGWFRFIILAVGLMVGFIALDVTTEEQLLIPTIILCGTLSIFFVGNIVFWRCPYCGKMLPMGMSKCKICPYCGEKIDEYK